MVAVQDVGTSSPSFILDGYTAFALTVAFSLMPAAQLLAAWTLPKTTPKTYYYLFLWHTYDFLTHYIIEGAFLFHSFFSYTELPIPTSDWPHPASRRFDLVPSLWNRSDRRYGARYSSAPMARLWQEYAKADRRWENADLNVISVEILTVGLAAPTAAYVSYLISKWSKLPASPQKAQVLAKLWFWAICLALGELYGGFMTFGPEWLKGNQQLSNDPVYLWLYLVFFNMLWVFIPFWVLWVGYGELSMAFTSNVRIAPSSKKER